MDYRYVGVFKDSAMQNYIVKIKFRDESFAWYSSDAFRETTDKLRSDEYRGFNMKRLFIPLERAQSVFKDYLLNSRRPEKELEYVAVIEMSTYEPYGEYRIIDYKGF